MIATLSTKQGYGDTFVISSSDEIEQKVAAYNLAVERMKAYSLRRGGRVEGEVLFYESWPTLAEWPKAFKLSATLCECCHTPKIVY